MLIHPQKLNHVRAQGDQVRFWFFYAPIPFSTDKKSAAAFSRLFLSPHPKAPEDSSIIW
jgi:hypothetical protein